MALRSPLVQIDVSLLRSPDPWKEDLISFDDLPPKTGIIIDVEPEKIDENKKKETKLGPKYSVIIDSSVLPARLSERKSQMFSLSNMFNLDFLRPVLIDGKAVSIVYNQRKFDRNIDVEEMRKKCDFMMIPLVRCLFYWISRGHKATLCLPDFSAPEQGIPEENQIHGHSISSIEILFKLVEAGLVHYMPLNFRNSYGWHVQESSARRAALVSDRHRWPKLDNQQMSHSPDSTSKEPENPWLLFQPFFSSEDVIYFPPASSTAPHPDWKNRISDFALMKISSVTSGEEFELFKDQQLLLVDQIKQMKLLLDILPEERKFFEQKAYECLIQKLLPDFERFEMHRQFINDNSLI